MWGSILFDDSFFSVLKGSLAALEAEEFGTRRVFDELAFCHDVPRFACDRRPRLSCRYRRALPIIGFCAGRMHG